MEQSSSSPKDIENIRREYSRQKLTEPHAAEQPLQQFEKWFEEALQAELPDANAVTLATATAAGKPSARMVLLKGYDEDGFRFYTNYESRKGQELKENPQAALCFFWSELERQVRVEGKVEKLSRGTSARYFQQRPRQSQLGAWASHQSEEVESREALESQLEQVEARFKGQKIPLPDFWGGFLLIPSTIEFWQGRPGRLHDRILYSKSDEGDWSVRRLAP